ncbi:MAG: hypothetical protein ABIH01_02765, partial [Candidatus Omnitrophota bacterium]
MNKNFITLLMAVLLGLSMSGCEGIGKTIKRKFIPKQKQEEKRKTFYGYQEEYRAEFPNATLYNNHYIYWKSWEGEL